MASWTLPEHVDLSHAPALLTELETHLDAAGTGELQFDASAMLAFDSSLLALILEARRRMQAAGGTVRVNGAPPKLTELARLYGVEELVFADAPSG